MQELFNKKAELEGYLNGFVEDLVEKVIPTIEENKYTRQELNAFMEIIRGSLSSSIGYKLGIELHWKASDLQSK